MQDINKHRLNGRCFFAVRSSAHKQVIACQKKRKDQKNCDKGIRYKQGDQHPRRYPEQGITRNPFHV